MNLTRIFIATILLMTSLDLYSQDCPKVTLSDFPKSDLPGEIDTSRSMQEKLKTQGSYTFYYGIGTPVDYVKARYLAFSEMALNKDGGGPFAGAYTLMMLYANGFGVKRNLDLSIRLACADEGAADVEIEGRVDHLRQLKAGTSKGVFDICDDITSGYMEGSCEGLHAEIADISRNAIIDSVVRGWAAKDKQAYDSLRKTATFFFDTRVMSEVDMGGTDRVAQEVREGESLEIGFKDKIMAADKRAFDPYTEQQWAAADQELNSAYRKLMHAKTDSIREQMSQITKEGIRSAQRAWIQYRDAWVDFCAVRCPAVTAITLKTMLTKERTSQLEDLLEASEL